MTYVGIPLGKVFVSFSQGHNSYRFFTTVVGLVVVDVVLFVLPVLRMSEFVERPPVLLMGLDKVEEVVELKAPRRFAPSVSVLQAAECLARRSSRNLRPQVGQGTKT